jgi:hypothetical protein
VEKKRVNGVEVKKLIRKMIMEGMEKKRINMIGNSIGEKI